MEKQVQTFHALPTFRNTSLDTVPFGEFTCRLLAGNNAGLENKIESNGTGFGISA